MRVGQFELDPVQIDLIDAAIGGAVPDVGGERGYLGLEGIRVGKHVERIKAEAGLIGHAFFRLNDKAGVGQIVEDRQVLVIGNRPENGPIVVKRITRGQGANDRVILERGPIGDADGGVALGRQGLGFIAQLRGQGQRAVLNTVGDIGGHVFVRSTGRRGGVLAGVRDAGPGTTPDFHAGGHKVVQGAGVKHALVFQRERQTLGAVIGVEDVRTGVQRGQIDRLIRIGQLAGDVDQGVVDRIVIRRHKGRGVLGVTVNEGPEHFG